MAIAGDSSSTSLPPQAPARRAGAVDYELFLDCVHCGLCTSACPTYLELGTEADSPRGRIYLMRAVTDGRVSLDHEVRRHLDLCLDCRACESACPSGVQYGKLIEPFRIQMAERKLSPGSMAWLQRLVVFHLTPYRRRLRLALAPARWLRRLGIDRLAKQLGLSRLLPRSLRQLNDMLPRLERYHARLPELVPAEGKRRARVGFFVGCAADVFFPETTLATIRVLQHNGCDVWIPPGQGCCGALHYHSAQEAAAQRFAALNCAAFVDRGTNSPGKLDAIIVNAAGCGAMLKDYGHLLANAPDAAGGTALAARVKDVSEFLIELGPVKPAHPIPIRAAYHDACHLCHAQQIRRQPRELLEMIPGLTLVPLAEPEICCGAAGSYNLSEPDMAERLGRRKASNIEAGNVQAVFAGNVGCLLQIGRYLRSSLPRLWLAHPVDALWASYRGIIPDVLDQKT
jgi:glycolate oxidase iron-sulfur subunit